MTVSEGFFAKKVGTGANEKSGLFVAKGNEIAIMSTSVTSTATAANQAVWVVPNGLNYRLTRMAIRATTTVVTGDTTVGSLTVKYAVTETATLASSLLTANFTTAGMSAGTTVTTDVTLAAPLVLAPGTLVALVNVAGAGGSPAGVASCTVFAQEVNADQQTGN